MARNKKHEFSSRLGSGLVALALFALFVPLGIGYVWFKDQNDVLGDQVKRQETALAALELENRNRRGQLADLCLPDALDKQVKKMNLGLIPALQTQIIWLAETPANLPANFQSNLPPAPVEQRRAQGVPRERNY
jgi:hypothetical protein